MIYLCKKIIRSISSDTDPLGRNTYHRFLNIPKVAREVKNKIKKPLYKNLL
jgi:hypothetical protein